jgi:asparagine synthetase B (glutamine-hydrolysing)
MCGIHLRVWKDKSCKFCQTVFAHDATGIINEDSGDNDDVFRDDNLRRRGPDSYGSCSTITHPEFYRIQIVASVLQMRAESREQPVSFVPGWSSKDLQNRKNDSENDNDKKDNHERNEEQASYLCWNGELYEELQSLSSPPNKNEHYDENNTKNVFSYEIADTNVVVNHLSEISDQQLNSPSSPQCHIANVMARLYNAEFSFAILAQYGIYFGRDVWGRRSLLQWKCPENCGSFQIVSVAEESPSMTSTTEESLLTTATATTTECPKSTTNHLEWIEVPPGMVHCILFSDPATIITEIYPNVTIPSPRVPDSFIVAPIPTQPPQEISNRLWRASLELEFYLRRAVAMRLDNSSRRSTGVLFSGGVDSVVLAALAADILSSQHRSERIKIESESRSELESSPYMMRFRMTEKLPSNPILYLYNVSFGPNPEKSRDREAALISYEALQKKYEDNNQTRDDDLNIVFRDIVVEWEDICRSDPHIRTLLLPKSTVMDVNIATALWFASQGGTTEETKTDTDIDTEIICNDHRSPRVLLLGMGADELMGGYGRHRKAYEEGGWEQFRKEITMDQNRLWERNCGRDDRLTSDHGREARFPFLDAHVVQFLQNSATEEDLICDFRLPPGVGDKRILRLIAQRLGCEHASGLVKRAIQFGSRVSHLSDKKRFGSRRKAKGGMKI